MKEPEQLAAEYFASDMTICEFAQLVQMDALESTAEVIGDIIRTLKTGGK